MGLSKEQLAIVDELKKQGDEYERLTGELPENTLAAWCNFVGQMREYFYMDEKWDGKEMEFLSPRKVSVKAILEADKISVFIIENTKEEKLAAVTEAGVIGDIIEMLIAKQLPERIMPADNINLSPGGGRCDLCLYNRENNEKHDRTIDLAMGFALCYGAICTSADCDGNLENCEIDDIGKGTPGLTAEQVTHILFPYWWAKSRFNR